MRPIANAVLALSALTLCHTTAAQMFKCTDKAGKISYTSQPCSQLGLKDAGEVRDLIQVTPAPPPSTYQPPARQTPVEEPPKPAAAAEPEKKAPERRCFVTTGAGGKKVTRCNDKPDEPAN